VPPREKAVPMTDDELKPHIGSLVVLEFVKGHQLLGTLVANPPVPGCKYAIEQGPNLHGIADASVVERVHSLEEPPEVIHPGKAP